VLRLLRKDPIIVKRTPEIAAPCQPTVLTITINRAPATTNKKLARVEIVGPPTLYDMVE
jgi:hypothetical protein